MRPDHKWGIFLLILLTVWLAMIPAAFLLMRTLPGNWSLVGNIALWIIALAILNKIFQVRL